MRNIGTCPCEQKLSSKREICIQLAHVTWHLGTEPCLVLPRGHGLPHGWVQSPRTGPSPAPLAEVDESHACRYGPGLWEPEGHGLRQGRPLALRHIVLPPGAGGRNSRVGAWSGRGRHVMASVLVLALRCLWMTDF